MKGQNIMRFAEKNGFVQEKSIQVGQHGRNRLFNITHRFSENNPFINDELKYVIDKLGWRVETTSRGNMYIIDRV